MPPLQAVETPKPELTDHNFWWFQTFVINDSADLSTDFRSDGLHFFDGGPTVFGLLEEKHARFGATADFSVQPERFPDSPSGLFLSAPQILLNGSLVGYAADWDPLYGKGEATCDLVVRQTLSQKVFGGTRIVAEKVITERLIDLTNGDGHSAELSERVPLVSFNTTQFSPDELWATIEVRFEVYVKQGGSIVWCNPKVVLGLPQWPLEALKHS
jgi:hypothetical protein